MHFRPGRSTAERVADRVTDVAHEARDQSADSIAHAREVLRNAAEASEGQLRSLGRQAQHASEEAFYSARDYSREHPAVIIGATVLSVWVLYNVLSRRVQPKSGVRRIRP